MNALLKKSVNNHTEFENTYNKFCYIKLVELLENLYNKRFNSLLCGYRKIVAAPHEICVNNHNFFDK